MRVQVYTAWGPMLLPARVKTIEEGEVFCRELIYVLEQMEGTGLYLHELRQELQSFLRKEKIDEREH